MSGPIDMVQGPPRAAWSKLGADRSAELHSVELVQVDLPFVTPVETSMGTHRHRPIVLVHLTGRRPGGAVVEGWGECGALADSTYDREDAESAYGSLESELVPTLCRATLDRGALPSVEDLTGMLDTGSHPLALAALEMAVGDIHLRADDQGFADLLGVGGRRIEPGAVLGLPRSADQLATDLGRLRQSGYARVKIKVAPGSEAIIDRAVRRWSGTGLLVQLDANGAYGADAAGYLQRFDDLDLVCIEQPLPKGDFEGHRRLAGELATPICLDESLDSPAAVVRAVEGGACSMVCVKPARLGGIGAALEVIAWCGAADVPWWIGGMFESGYARGVNRALASLADRPLPGDLSSPATYLGADLVETVPGEIEPATGHLLLPVPPGPGLGPAPDPALLEPWTVRRNVVALAGT